MAEPEHDATAPEPPLWLHDAEEVEQKYEEAVADAVEECADDTAGQTCFICLDAAEDEGLVRGCACRGAAGFAHVSCSAKQAKLLREEAEYNNLGVQALNARTRNGPRGACSAARTRTLRGLRNPCERREPRSAPAKRRRLKITTLDRRFRSHNSSLAALLLSGGRGA